MDKVIFAGWRQDVLVILPGCDLFIFTSENREIISNPEQRFPVDQPDILSKKINEILQSREKLKHFHRLTMAERNRFVFDWEDKIIEKAEKVIALGT